jgi:hypothetical protein
VCFENYKLLKSLLKDLTAKLPTINENQLNKSLNILLSILFDLIKKQTETQLNAQKSLIDILSSFWELFSKQLVSTS